MARPASTHCKPFAQAVFFGVGLLIVWPKLPIMAAIGTVLFAFALIRFRATMSAAR